MIAVGEQAPEFELVSTRGQCFSLGDFAGHQDVMLVFYPNGHTGCCGDKLTSRDISDHLESFLSVNVEPLAIVADGSLSASGYMESLDLPFPVVVDMDNLVHLEYGLIRERSDLPIRATVVVTKDGRIALVDQGRPTVERMLNEIYEFRLNLELDSTTT